MSKLQDCSVELRGWYPHTICIALYYAGTPTREELLVDIKSTLDEFASAGMKIFRERLSEDLSEPRYGYDEVKTKLSAAAGMKRYECFPVG